MAVVRNITGESLLVHVAGGIHVGSHKEAEVPDEDFLDRAWPTSTWKLVKKPSGKGVRDVSLDDAIVFSAAAETESAETSPENTEESA